MTKSQLLEAYHQLAKEALAVQRENERLKGVEDWDWDKVKVGMTT